MRSSAIPKRLEQAAVYAADGCDRAASQHLFAALYHELHRLAQRALHRDGGTLSISATTLLHEAYLNLSDRTGIRFSEPGQFLAYASRAMRGLIIDAMRRRRSLKRGADFVITPLGIYLDDDTEDREFTHINEAWQVLAEDQEFAYINEALVGLAAVDSSLAELVDLKYFCGLSLVEIGALRGVSEKTVQREWEKARLFLFKSLTERDSP